MGCLRAYPFRITYGPADDRLHEFYLPALERSVAYDRSAGFFSSSALAIAAAGIARLIQNGGRMRLLVGADLQPEDVDAIVAGEELAAVVRQRLLARLTTPEDELMRDRLAALAWMVAEGLLEVRVVLPCDATGRPLPAERAEEYFHAKEGVFTDAHGDRIAFSGSVNESVHGWQHNYEQFAVYFSWDTSRPYLEQVVHRFERLWTNAEPGWISLPLPEAVRAELLRYRPSAPPVRDPLERTVGVREQREGYTVERGDARAVLLARFLRDAPLLVGAEGLGVATAAIQPWPHQLRVSRALIERFPERFLLADEVGLGKTIEVGLALRQLVLDRRVQRALLLVPHSVIRQWQEELYEKFCLDVPRYEDGKFWSVRGGAWEPRTANPFASEPVFLVSSQLAKRRDRSADVLDAGPWDLVVVDEAHHARRGGFERGLDQPNRLLALLRQLSERTRGLWLLSATPMQLHPIELWDLLVLLGLGGRWGASPSAFLRFYEELRRGPAELDWSFVLGLVREEVRLQGLDPVFAREAEKALDVVGWEEVRRILSGESQRSPHHLSPPQRQWLFSGLRRHTPLRRVMFRHTRALLRRYVERGLLEAQIPTRHPRPVWIEMSPVERELYERIEEYTSQFYGRYEAERPGLGFVMTVYRRRLTSSFFAARCSLERRLQYLRQQRPDLGISDEDVEDEELELDISETLASLPEGLAQAYRDEIAYLEDFVAELARLGEDSKFACLHEQLQELFRRHETVAVFTQYTDTMDYLRERLVAVYGSRVACYSGRGGERWRGGHWVPVTKEEIKNAFREGRDVTILLCTDAASEGLNLQTCGALVNYDLPWNPMRVEQRIGRFDRIGQRYPRVDILNFFYADSVEAEIYRRLSDRIDWFETVVGPLQPILTQVARSIQRVALQPRQTREQVLRDEIAEIQRRLDAHEQASLDLDATLYDETFRETIGTPVSLADLERVVPTLPGLAERFRPHPEIVGAWLVSWHDRLEAVTFDPEVYDRHSGTVRFLTYGDPFLLELLEQVDASGSAPAPGIVRLEHAGPPPRCGYYRVEGDRAVWVRTLSELEEAQPTGAATVEPPGLAAAEADFSARLAREHDRYAEHERRQRELLDTQLLERARQVLVEAALVEIALGRKPALAGGHDPLTFGREAVRGLARHGYPFAPLLRLVGSQQPLEAREDDPHWEELRALSVEQLQARWRSLRREAEELVHRLAPPQ
ncbi:SNF2-related protein [Thermomicrobium sp. 4228-Ro]|uniref:DEAD/DEAH box helicase n=1 Tax=Thermomicrobium sp. 4228-Ro TaxID=2993937 RepID=UPI002248ADA4|nr:SNF2-related protein [Thermomicrobium sp. 4228-Ro]MCX2727450.1 SNF2-related protein [Thermomicrobium sp. 4228-Ro]